MSSSEKSNILVVDDLPDKLFVFKTILEELGENVVTARSGEEALHRVLEKEFAVILLDVNMPGMDGYETAAYIRRRKKSAHTPIIFITAFADQVQAIEGYSVGAVDYIVSPVVPEILRSKVKVFVDLYRLTQQIRRQADEQVSLAREQAARAAAEEATRRSAFLAEAGTVLGSSLDVETTQRALVRSLVPFLADVAAVTLTDERGQPRDTELAWMAGTGIPNVETVAVADDLSPQLARGIDQALQTGKSVALTNLGSSPVAELPPTPRAGELPPTRALESLLVLPLLARGRTLGTMALGLGPSGRRHSRADLSLAEEMASRAAIALDNARLYQNVQEADRRKNEFLVMLAHELRNPLAPIQNAVQLLRFMKTLEPAASEACDMIGRQVTHMARLIDDLLDMSRLARGKILLRKQPLNLVELVRNTTDDYRPILAASGLQLDVRLPDQPLYVEGDPTRLAQIVGNGLHNANKFTDPGGRVAVGVTPCASRVRITILDTGIGMEPEMLARVFETFSQADNSLDRSRGGLGLGLALVKGMVELHQGEVGVTSPGPGRGTELTIHLPLSDGAPPLAPAPAPAPGTANPTNRILIIEDNPDAAESMRRLFVLTGHEVQVASAGPAGIAAARDFRPDVVLCDIGLPGGMDGYGVAETLRRDAELATVRLIALTGYGQEQDQKRSREAGFDAHLTKPVDFPELKRLLETLPALK